MVRATGRGLRLNPQSSELNAFYIPPQPKPDEQLRQRGVGEEAGTVWERRRGRRAGSENGVRR